MKLRSIEVHNPDRAGRAPYNFVPLPESCFSAAEPKGQDTWEPVDQAGRAEAWSGYLDFDLRALTPFYTRGMWSLQDFRNQKDAKQVRPFDVANRLRLPGSSLRGMIRTLVEILSSAPLAPANEPALAYRAVAETINHPLGKQYKDWLANPGYDTLPKAKPGWLHVDESGDSWWIHPSQGPLTNDKDPYSKDWRDKWERGDNPSRTSRVRSGYIRKKRAVWIVPPEDTTQRFELTDDEIGMYKRTITATLEERGWVYGKPDSVAPVFYIHVPHNGQLLTLFGHTPFFRLPYLRGVKEANPSSQPEDGSWDIAQSMFGRVPDRKRAGARSRLYFEDGMYVRGPHAYQQKPFSFVLSSPKPTTYQHYLVQTGTDVSDVLHWERTGVVVRGHKLYWHRPNATVPPSKTDKSATQFSPAQKDAIFHARIRFDQLAYEELGLLLMAVALPRGCAHHFGMAKAHGFGSFAVENVELSLVERTARYKTFFEGTRLFDALVPLRPELVLACQEVFVRVFYNCESLDQFWALERFQDLKALLSMPTENQEGWNGRTRCLEFGTIPNFNVNPRTGRETPYNEYLLRGYGKYPKARPEPLKVLPPAMQVWQDRSLPSDERPPFRAEPPI